MKKIINQLLAKFLGVNIIKAKSYETFSKVLPSLVLYSNLPDSKKKILAQYLPFSKSQLGQDILALAFANQDSENFFVEFGSTNGIDLSNTYLLEKHCSWKGLLLEPAKCWHEDLKNNRSCLLDFRCVSSQSDTHIEFAEVKQSDSSGSSPELSSTLDCLKSNKDGHHNLRKANSIIYQVNTVTLIDALNQHNMPRNISYLSVDTEGSEYEILKNFDFSQYTFNIISVEHNFTENRVKILKLMEDSGYSRIYESISLFDDWFINKNLLSGVNS